MRSMTPYDANAVLRTLIAIEAIGYHVTRDGNGLVMQARAWASPPGPDIRAELSRHGAGVEFLIEGRDLVAEAEWLGVELVAAPGGIRFSADHETPAILDLVERVSSARGVQVLAWLRARAARSDVLAGMLARARRGGVERVILVAGATPHLRVAPSPDPEARLAARGVFGLLQYRYPGLTSVELLTHTGDEEE